MTVFKTARETVIGAPKRTTRAGAIIFFMGGLVCSDGWASGMVHRTGSPPNDPSSSMRPMSPVAPFGSPIDQVGLGELSETPYRWWLCVDDIEDDIKALKTAFAKEEDEKAIELIDELIVVHRKAEPDEIKKLVKVLRKTFDLRRKKDALFLAVAAAFSELGAEGEKALIAALKHKKLRKRPEVIAQCLRALGDFKNPKNVKTIVRYLENDDPEIIGAAAESLGSYRRAKETTRKQADEGMVKCYVKAQKQVERNPDEEEWENRLDRFELRIINSLSELTGETYRTASEWDEWFEENKAKKWD